MKSISFMGGFALGLLCISLVQAALPKRVTPQTSEVVTELKAAKVTAPDLEQDFDRLERAEGQYAESWDQQQRIRAAAVGGPAPSRPAPARVAGHSSTTIRTQSSSAEQTRSVKPQTSLPTQKKRPSR
jgi:hypothetical protein